MKKLKVKKEWELVNGKYRCPYCKSEYSKFGITTHIWRMHGDGKAHDPNNGYLNKSRSSWNKGKTKITDKRILKQANTLSDKYKSGELIPSFTNKKHTDKTKSIISKKLSKNNNGGRCKWYNFKKSSGEIVKVQGTWEYRFAKVLEFIDVDWIKIKAEKHHLYEWVDDIDTIHHYTPDFYSPKLDKYFEIKGYWWGNDKMKMEYVKTQYNNVIFDVIRKTELLKYEKLFNTITTNEELIKNKI